MKRSNLIADQIIVWCIAMLGVSGGTTVALADQATPDRPGRYESSEPAPATQPSTQPSPTQPSGGEAASDQDLLDQTAAALGIRPPLSSGPTRSFSGGSAFALSPRVPASTSRAPSRPIIPKTSWAGSTPTATPFATCSTLRVSVDTKALLGLYGGTFSVDFQNQNGRNGSDKLTGDVQGFDNDDADGRTQVSELWYQQLFFVDKLRIKVGKVDANTEFAFPEYGTGFLNSSFRSATRRRSSPCRLTPTPR